MEQTKLRIVCFFIVLIQYGFLFSQTKDDLGVDLVILGTAQDAGAPHIACSKACCTTLLSEQKSHSVVSLGLIDKKDEKVFLVEATPDISTQLKALKRAANAYFPYGELPDGIFLTHAHIGHYSGLMYLGKEACNSSLIPVYAMPAMKMFLESNGPWSQLVDSKNISLQQLKGDSEIKISSGLKITPFLVPHRDEFSETVGFKIEGPSRSALFIPDIDKWKLWEKSIIDEIAKVDYAFLDATFFDGAEINYRDISEIPHPFVIESMELLKNLPAKEKNKLFFIHLNHTNPLLDPNSEASSKVKANGFNVARKGMNFKL